MKIQLLAPSKLKIIFTMQDLEENEISLHSFLSGSKKSKLFLKAILEIATEDFGINFSTNNFSYEIFCFNFCEFIIFISYVNTTEKAEKTILHFNFIDKQLVNYNISNQNLFYFFSNYESFLSFSEYIKKTLLNKKISSTLFKYSNIFLLEISTDNLSNNEIKALHAILSEITEPSCISKKINSYISNLSITHFKEFSEKLISNNALGL